MDAPGGIERLPVPRPIEAKTDTGNPPLILANDADLLAILANKEISNEQFDDSEWRIEVYTNRNGRRYWNLRRRGKRGGKDNWRYGGKFDDLNADRQAQYWQRAKSG